MVSLPLWVLSCFCDQWLSQWEAGSSSLVQLRSTVPPPQWAVTGGHTAAGLEFHQSKTPDGLDSELPRSLLHVLDPIKSQAQGKSKELRNRHTLIKELPNHIVKGTGTGGPGKLCPFLQSATCIIYLLPFLLFTLSLTQLVYCTIVSQTRVHIHVGNPAVQIKFLLQYV